MQVTLEIPSWAKYFYVEDSLNIYSIKFYRHRYSKYYEPIEELEKAIGIVKVTKIIREKKDAVLPKITPNKYNKEIAKVHCECGRTHSVIVDVYKVLGAFTSHYNARIKPIIDHLVKKLLAGGERGHKDLQEDLDDVILSSKRAKEELNEWA